MQDSLLAEQEVWTVVGYDHNGRPWTSPLSKWRFHNWDRAHALLEFHIDTDLTDNFKRPEIMRYHEFLQREDAWDAAKKLGWV